MKKLTTLFCALFFSCAAFAQIPNAGFENWTAGTGYDTPDGWGNANPLIGGAPFSVVTCAKGSPGYNGSLYFIQLTSKTVAGTTVVPGIAATGTITLVGTTPSINSTMAISARPKSLTGEWAYTPASGDQGSINVFLTKWNTDANKRDTISLTNYLLPTPAVANLTAFSFDLTYLTGDYPDTGLIVLLSGMPTGGTDGSTLSVDDLAFTGSVAAVKTVDNAAIDMSLSPNPATNNTHISYNSRSAGSVKISITDINGKVIKEMSYNKVSGMNDFSVDLGNIPAGIYFTRLADEVGVSVKKLIVQ